MRFKNVWSELDFFKIIIFIRNHFHLNVFSFQLYIPSEFDLSASAWAANALVRSNSNSWNCFDSDDCIPSPDLKK